MMEGTVTKAMKRGRERPDLSFLDDVAVDEADQTMEEEAEERGWRGTDDSTILDYGTARFEVRAREDDLVNRIEARVGRDPRNTGMDILSGSHMSALQDL
jgi:hypothetical protein